MNFPLRGALLVLSGLALPARAHADPPDAKAAPESASQSPPPAEKSVDVVITGTRTAESGRRAPVRVEVVTREEAERRGATDIAQALQGQLGVQVNPSAYGFLGNPSAIQIQGFDRERVLILEDGERVVGDVGGAIDLSSIPLTDVSRIEVVTGPTSSLYGTSAIGGVVNILTAPPETEGFSGRARLEGRSFKGLVFQGNGAYRSEDKWLGLDASFQRSDGIALTEGVPDLVLPESMRFMVGLRGGAALGEHIETRVRLRFLRDNLMGLESQVVPGLKTYLIDLPETIDRISIQLSEIIRLSESAQMRIALGRQQFSGTSEKDRRDSPADEMRTRSDIMQSIEVSANVIENARTWTLGMRAESEHFRQEISRTVPSQGSLVTTNTMEVPRTSLGSASLYGQLQWKLKDSFSVLGGLRGEKHLRYGGVLAPRLSMMWNPWAPLVIRASLGRGFRAPSAKEFGFVFDHSYYGYRVQGNSDLIPEKSWGLNGDISLAPIKGLIIRGGIFGNWIRDLIDIDYNPVLTAGGIAEYKYRNVGEARTMGFQFDASWRVIPKVRVETGYAYLWTRDDVNLRPLEGRPPHTVYSALNAQLPWSLEMVLRWRAVTDAFIDENLRSPGFETLDARLSRTLWPKAIVYVGGLNLLDVKKDPSRLGDQRPITGRTLYAGIRSELPF